MGQKLGRYTAREMIGDGDGSVIPFTFSFHLVLVLFKFVLSALETWEGCHYRARGVL